MIANELCMSLLLIPASSACQQASYMHIIINSVIFDILLTVSHTQNSSMLFPPFYHDEYLFVEVKR